MYFVFDDRRVATLTKPHFIMIIYDPDVMIQITVVANEEFANRGNKNNMIRIIIQS